MIQTPMKTIPILIILLITMGAGCVGQMNNDEIINETKKCEDADLIAEYQTNAFLPSLSRIVCKPKDL